MHIIRLCALSGLVFNWILATCGLVFAAKHDGQLRLKVVEPTTGKPLTARVELLNSRGRPVRLHPANAIAVDSYYAFQGEIELQLKKGDYRFFLEAGPEFRTQRGHFKIERHADDMKTVELKRSVDMAAEGWWAADLDVSHRSQALPLLMRASGVDFVPLTMQTNEHGKCEQAKEPTTSSTRIQSPPLFGPWASIDARAESGLIALSRTTFLPTCDFPIEDFSLASFESARSEGHHLIAWQADSWDLPIWVALGWLDAVQIQDRNTLPLVKGQRRREGFPPDRKLFKAHFDQGRWREVIYHQLLNAGLRIPPAGGSGAGALARPIGSNRTYAYVPNSFTRQAWMAALEAGRVMVSNGPLLRTMVRGQPPGHVFSFTSGSASELQIALNLTFHQDARVDYLEILQNGKVLHHVRLVDLAQRKGQLPTLRFEESGWFSVRAVTNETEYYQFAATGPYYVEVDGKPRISRQSCQFFLDWVELASKKFSDQPARQQALDLAREFWSKRRELANVE